VGFVFGFHCTWLGMIIFILKPSRCPLLDSTGRKKKQEKGKVLFDTLEMQQNEMVKYYGGKI